MSFSVVLPQQPKLCGKTALAFQNNVAFQKRLCHFKTALFFQKHRLSERKNVLLMEIDGSLMEIDVLKNRQMAYERLLLATQKRIIVARV